MRINEFIEKLEKIHEKTSLHFRVVRHLDEMDVFISFTDEDLLIAQICEKKENVMDTKCAYFINLDDELRAELFDLFTEYAKTPIGERTKEKIFIIPLPGLVTTDGEQQYLTHKDNRFFACRRKKSLRQTWKEKDLRYIPERYRQYAVEVKE